MSASEATAGESPDREASFAANRSLWDAWTAVHAAGDFYDLEGFRAGGIRLRDEEVEAVGDVHGRTLLHLQCHFGIDTLSWARLGATVTGADFSPAAVRLARELAADLGLPDARFVESNLYDLPATLEAGDGFDIVYTSRGVLGWLPDIAGWARVVAHFVRPGGVFYISEIHPVANAFENEGVAAGELRLAYPYWEHRDPLVFPVQGSYADETADVGDQTEHGWDHGLGEIVSALIAAGLRIEWLRESPELDWKLDFLVESAPGSDRWRLPPEAGGELPLMFSLLASKPAGCVRSRRPSGRPASYTPPIELPASGHPVRTGRTIGRTTMTKHARHEREQRAAETARMKEIESAWYGSLTPAVAEAFSANVAVARARGPQEPPPPMAPGTPPQPPRPGREPRPSKEERKRSRPFKD